MNIAILQQELNELKNNPMLFNAYNFRARKEALDFVRVIKRIHTENYADTLERVHLQKEARALKESLHSFNMSIAQDWHTHLKSERPTPKELRAWLQPYTDYVPQQWGSLITATRILISC